MPTRKLFGLICAIVTVPLAVLGVFELEGLLAFLAAGMTMALTRWISRVPLPALAWVSWLVAIGLLVLAVGSALLKQQAVSEPSLPWWMAVLLVAYEIAVVLTVVGSVWYVIRHIRNCRQVPA